MRRLARTSLIATAALLCACASPEPAARPQVAPEPAARQAAGPTPEPAEPVHAAPAPAAAPVQAGAPAVAAAAAANGVRHFGAPIAGDATVAHLGEIVGAPAQFQNRPLRIEGTVAAVCQEMGCWMEIRDDATQAHVRMHGHSFFLPRDISGHRAAVQATVVAAHPATHCDQEAHAATGRVAQVELDATGVEIYN